MTHSRFVTILVFVIRIYQKTVSPDHGLLRSALGPVCRFTPTCSQYATQAIEQYGWRGIGMVVKRIGRCHPFAAGGHDPVPRH
ncbi:MAG: membrane protein insertion efficiency factor YidD [Candidatus Andersenbacteria bacterium]